MNKLILNNANLQKLLINLNHVDREIKEVERLTTNIRTKINTTFWELIELNNQQSRRTNSK